MKSYNFPSILVLTLSLSLFLGGTALAETYSSTTAGTHAIEADGTTVTYTSPTVTKTGDVSGQDDDYDWVGTNAAVWAGNGAVLTITGGTIDSQASYGNAVFSYGGTNSNTNNNQGDGTTVNISGTTITTTKNNSGGIMTTGGGIMNATNLTITTSGGSSAAIRSDSGGGTVTVNGGTYTTSGQGSPAIYSTAAITVSNATLKSGIAQGVVIEGGNSVTLTGCDVTASHTTKNGDDLTYQGILIYKSMSLDASSGTSAFKMINGSFTNVGGDIFCVTNTTCTINLQNVTITNNDSSGNFLRAAGQNWGTSGSNGGTVTLTAASQDIEGNILVDASSSLTMTLKAGSTYKGAINNANTASSVALTIEGKSTWTLTGDSHVTSLTLNSGSTIEYGSYTLYVGSTEYTASSTFSSNGTDDDDSTATEEVDDTDSSDSSSNSDSSSSTDTTGGDSSTDSTTGGDSSTDSTTGGDSSTDSTTGGDSSTDTTNGTTGGNGSTTTTTTATSTAPDATVTATLNETTTKSSIVSALTSLNSSLTSTAGSTLLTDLTATAQTYSTQKVASYVSADQENPITLESWKAGTAGIYLREISRDSNINALAGKTIHIYMLKTSEVTAAGFAHAVKTAVSNPESTGVFLNSSGTVLTTMPSTGAIYTAVYMAANTDYTPLITSDKTTTDGTTDTTTDTGNTISSSGGGCNLIRNEGLGIRNVLILVFSILGLAIKQLGTRK